MAGSEKTEDFRTIALRKAEALLASLERARQEGRVTEAEYKAHQAEIIAQYNLDNRVVEASNQAVAGVSLLATGAGSWVAAEGAWAVGVSFFSMLRGSDLLSNSAVTLIDGEQHPTLFENGLIVAGATPKQAAQWMGYADFGLGFLSSWYSGAPKATASYWDDGAQAAASSAGRADNVIGLSGAEKAIQLTKKTFGHTFTTHGDSMTNFLVNRARGSGMAQGQFLDNQKAAQFILDNISKTANGAVNVPIPKGFPARVIMPDGTFKAATHIRLVPGGNGVKTAYPLIP